MRNRRARAPRRARARRGRPAARGPPLFGEGKRRPVAPPAAQAAMHQALLSLPKKLQDAGTALHVQNTFMKGADLEPSLTGNLTADHAAAVSAFLAKEKPVFEGR